MSAPPLTPDTPIATAIERLPGARRALFARYHIGGCSSCAFQPGETLAELCLRNDNIPVQEMIDHLLTSHANDQKMLISPSDLAGQLAEAEDEGLPLHLIDLRTREEFEAVAIPGAHLFSQDLQREAFADWEKSDPVVLYDHTGTRALDAAAYFAGHGFTNVRALDGGIDRFSLEADPSLPRYQVEFEEDDPR
jgi:rhodanese-related sulfurtransferase